MSFTEINDIREQSEFKGISFSKFKKSDVKKQLVCNLLNGKIEKANYWCAELICAGHYGELWDTIINFISKHIHTANPKIFLYIQNRICIFKDIISNKEFITELHSRNHNKLRMLFAEIITILTISNKKNGIEPVKINKNEEFDITVIPDKLKADKMDYIQSVFLKKDPKELFIALNEMYYCIINKDYLSSCFWYEWIIEFESACKKVKRPCLAEARNYSVQAKFRTNVVWIIWDILFELIENKNINMLMNLLKASIDIFTINYTTASCKKRRFIIYYSISLCIDNINVDYDIISDKHLVSTVISNIDIIYKQIKKNEVSPQTDYLFNNLEKQNSIKKSVQQMDIVNSIEFDNNI
jgi:hypothetical protein